MKFGPVKTAPNPIQRRIQLSPLLGTLVFMHTCAWVVTGAIAIGGHSMWFAVATHVLCLIIGLAGYRILKFDKLAKDEIENALVPYLPWPTWAPGYSHQHRGDLESAPEPVQPRPSKAQPSVEKSRVNTGPAAKAPNPLQRWEVGHPYLARALMAVWIVGLPSARILGNLPAAILTLAVFMAVALRFLLHARRSVGQDRGRREVWYAPWPSWLPGRL